MEKNLIIILSMLSIISLAACNTGKGDGKISKEDSVAIIKDFVQKANLVSPKTLKEATKNYTSARDFETYILNDAVPPVWKSRGTLVPWQEAREQIDAFVEGADTSQLRSILISREVFQRYIGLGNVENFKLCIGVGRDTTVEGRPLRRNHRTFFVLAVDNRGNYVTIRDDDDVEWVYDQISPCPRDCPPYMSTGRAHCDYTIPGPTSRCSISVNHEFK